MAYAAAPSTTSLVVGPLADATGVSDTDDMLDIFSSSVFNLYAELPSTIPSDIVSVEGIVVSAPNTISQNWVLQAHGVWRSAIHLATHLHTISQYLSSVSGRTVTSCDVLELGAASGLPGLVLAKTYSPRSITLSDYPDPNILSTLRNNITRNSSILPSNTQYRVVGHTWGEDPIPDSIGGEISGHQHATYDVIIAADVLWLHEQHSHLCDSLATHLRPDGVIFLVAGLHTGRYVIAGFLKQLDRRDLAVQSLCEVRLRTDSDDDGEELRRDWTTEREGETNADRSFWVIEILLTRKAT